MNSDGTATRWDPDFVYAPLTEPFRKQYASVRSRVKADKLKPAVLPRQSTERADEILRLCDEGERFLNRVVEILEIDSLGSKRLLQLFAHSQPLKQAYNELNVRLLWIIPHQHGAELKGTVLISPFPFDCLINPPPFLAGTPKIEKGTLLKHLRYMSSADLSSDASLDAPLAFINAVGKGRDADPKSRYMKAVVRDVASLQTWKQLSFTYVPGGPSLPQQLIDLVTYHCELLSQARDEQEIANEWLEGTIASKDRPKAKGNKKQQGRKQGKGKQRANPKAKADNKRAVQEVTVEQPEAAEELQKAEELPTPLVALKKRSRFVKDVELLNELFNYDRIVEANNEYCIFRQNMLDGRQTVVVLFNYGDDENTFDSSVCDVAAFKRKRDMFHTISPILCDHAHFGYWIDSSTIGSRDGVHQRLEKPIRLKPLQRALIITAKIIHTPYSDGNQALRQPGTMGAYVLIFEGNACFHAMFHPTKGDA